MTLAAVRPFDYATDGSFARASVAWGVNPSTGLVESFTSGTRRVFSVSGLNYILIEGARTNHCPDGEVWSVPPWVGSINDADVTANPTGGGVSNNVAAAGAGLRSFTLDGPIDSVALSCFLQPVSAPDSVDLALVNATPGTATSVALAAGWQRAQLQRAIPNDTNQRGFTVDATSSADDILGWAAQVETGPAFAPVLFASSPILTAGAALERVADAFSFPDAIGSTEAARVKGFVCTFRPVFSSSQLQSGDRLVMHAITNSSGSGEFFAIAIRVFSGPIVRVVVTRGSTVVQSGAVTFSADQELVARTETDGSLTLTGFTTGNGSFAGTAYTIPQGTIRVGVSAPGSEGFAVLAPIEYLVTAPEIVSAAPVTRGIVRVAFSEAMKATSAGDADDALNPANYTPSTGVIASVQQASSTEFDLIFTANLPPSTLVTIDPANIVTTASPAVPVGADTAQFTSLALPRITSVSPLSLSTVSVQFSEKVKQTSALDSDDALNPANYAFTAGVALPAIASVTASLFGSDVTVNFAADLPEGELVSLIASSIVSRVDAEPIDPAVELFFTSATAPVTVSVTQVATNAARVVFSVAVRQVNPDGAADALNPDNYLVTSPNSSAPFLQYVAPVSSQEVEIVFDGALSGGGLIFVTPQNLGSADVGIPVVAAQFFFEAFAEADRRAHLAPPARERYDLSNPQTPNDAAGAALGTFQMTESGDLANDTGRPYLRKRIFRRLSTTPGGFFHLPGYGLRPADKQAITATLLRELQRDIEAQVASERDVVAVRARLREIAPGVVGVRLRVQDDLGPFEIEGRIDLTGDAGA